jgi:hypothetical protein
MNKQQIIDDVQSRLDRALHNGLSLSVVGSRVRRDGSWWYVPVKPGGTRLPPADFLYSTYAAIEADIAEDHQLDVLLVPVAPEA